MWADNNYFYKKKITIDYTKVSSDETNFPVLISITDPNLADTSNGGHVESSSGYDICFYDSLETTLLYHDIEKYVNTSGLLVFWVNIPSLSSTSNTIIYIYYGKSGVIIDPSSTSTWNSKYKIVCHMNESSGNLDDRTANNHNGTANGNPIYSQIGQIGDAISFDGVADYFNFGDSDDFSPMTGQSIYLWIYQNVGAATTKIIVGKEQPASPFGEYSISTDPSNSVSVYMRDDNTTAYIGRQDANGRAVLEDNWRQLVYTWNGGTTNASIDIYIDGVPTDDTNYNNGIFTARRNLPASLALGTSLYTTPNGLYDFTGLICEFRFCNDDLSSTWLATEFNNQSSPSTFMDFDVEIPQVSTTPLNAGEVYHLVHIISAERDKISNVSNECRNVKIEME